MGKGKDDYTVLSGLHTNLCPLMSERQPLFAPYISEDFPSKQHGHDDQCFIAHIYIRTGKYI